MTTFYRNTPNRLLFALVLLLFWSSWCGAQGGSMELTITDEGGKKLKDVSVHGMKEGTSEVVAEGTTNKKGLLKATFPEAGFYAIEMSKTGYPTQVGRVEIREAMNTTVSLTLYSEQTFHKQQAINAFNAGVAKLQGTGQEDQALADFVEAAKLDPQLAEAQRLTAIVAATKENLELTKTALESYLALVPDGLPRVATAAYFVYRKTGRQSELPAVREALQAAGYSGDVAIGVFNEGVRALEAARDQPALDEQKTEEAKALFTEALRLDPQLSVAHRSLAAIEFNHSNYEAALPHLEKLLAQNPNHRDGNRMAFFSQAALGHREQAIAAGKKWAERDPKAAEEIAAKAAEYYEHG